MKAASAPVLLVELSLDVIGHCCLDVVLSESGSGRLDRKLCHLLGHVDRLDLRLQIERRHASA